MNNQSPLKKMLGMWDTILHRLNNNKAYVCFVTCCSNNMLAKQAFPKKVKKNQPILPFCYH